MGALSVFVTLFAVLAGVFFVRREPYKGLSEEQAELSIFDFQVRSADDSYGLSDLRGSSKAYLVVNVASQCGLTQSNYAGLQELYDKYKSSGLEILAFPCDSFGHQEPGTNDAILSFARENKGATFPVFEKVECDAGDATHPLYGYLRQSIDGGLLGQGLKWNFAKFLIDADGRPIKRYLPTAAPMNLEEDIVKLLTA